jgi:transcriptional regulator with XRE-family HTH domain
MTNEQESTSGRVVRHVQYLRKQRGWTASRLAEECASHGHPEVTDQVIYNLEQRRREEVSVDQLMAFAEALAVPVTVLLGATGPMAVLLFESDDEQRELGAALQKVWDKLGWIATPLPLEQGGT